jgi:hypothetical protein
MLLSLSLEGFSSAKKISYLFVGGHERSCEKTSDRKEIGKEV